MPPSTAAPDGPLPATPEGFKPAAPAGSSAATQAHGSSTAIEGVFAGSGEPAPTPQRDAGAPAERPSSAGPAGGAWAALRHGLTLLPGYTWLAPLAVRVAEHHAARAASAMAFDLFLAGIPMTVLLGWFSATLLRSDAQALGALSSLLDVAPQEVAQLIEVHLDRIADSSLAPLAVVGALWIASGAFDTVMSVIEIAVQAPRRPWWKKRLIGLSCVLVGLAGPVLGGVATVVLAGGPVALLTAVAGRQVLGAYAVGLLVAAATLLLLVAGFLRFAVERPGVERRVWPGACVTVSIGAAASWGFGVYARHLASYATLYGSVATITVVLIWLWLCCAALLLGAEVNAQLEGKADV